jgi:hypothetical protein
MAETGKVDLKAAPNCLGEKSKQDLGLAKQGKVAARARTSSDPKYEAIDWNREASQGITGSGYYHSKTRA